MENNKLLEQWFFDEYLFELSDKTSSHRGYMRALGNIANKKNKKIVEQASKYLIEQGLDAELVHFLKNIIANDLSEWAAEEAAEEMMGC